MEGSLLSSQKPSTGSNILLFYETAKVQYRTSDSNKSALLCDAFTDANNSHLADMTEHTELLADSGFKSYNQVSYKTLELYILSYKSPFTDIMEK
jgi:hypothetical protein